MDLEAVEDLRSDQKWRGGSSFGLTLRTCCKGCGNLLLRQQDLLKFSRTYWISTELVWSGWKAAGPAAREVGPAGISRFALFTQLAHMAASSQKETHIKKEAQDYSSSSQSHGCISVDDSLPVVSKMTTFDLWLFDLGGGAWGAGTNMWHPDTPASYESLPAPFWPHRFPHFGYIHLGGGGVGIQPICKCRCPPLLPALPSRGVAQTPTRGRGDFSFKQSKADYPTRRVGESFLITSISTNLKPKSERLEM